MDQVQSQSAGPTALDSVKARSRTISPNGSFFALFFILFVLTNVIFGLSGASSVIAALNGGVSSAHLNVQILFLAWIACSQFWLGAALLAKGYESK